MCWEDVLSSFNPRAAGTHPPAPAASQALESHGFQALAKLLGATRAINSGLALWVGTVEVRLMGAMYNMAQAVLRMLQPLILTLGLTEGAKRRPSMYHEGA